MRQPISKGALMVAAMQTKPYIIPTSLFLLLLATSALAAPVNQVAQFRVTVTSNQDGPIQPDEVLTLREAIQLVTGTLSTEKLSTAEQAQVQALTASEPSRIEFNLPADQTTIQLVQSLPDLDRPVIIDGTTQPGYVADQSAINELPIPVPVVAIAPATGVEIFRGLTITSDNVTVRGLSLYGFTSTHRGATASTPPADIFISHRLPPPDISKQPTPANFSPFYSDDIPPKNVVIENNWIGIPPSASASNPTPQDSPRSAFGVSVFNAVSTTIRRNWIADHDGSAIITSVQAENLNVVENVITGNGVAGMPDAIRLEGAVNQAQINSNLICGNDGSAVYLFKPEGSVQIRDNQMTYNGRRLRRSAVYLMGNNHRVTGNQIRYQTGPGIVVAAYPRSISNLLTGNRFSNLEGLSIDLVTQQSTTAGTGVYEYQRGDGPNPPRETANRRKDTGNSAINAPQFITRTFVALATQPGTATTEPSLLGAIAQSSPVQIYGTADPGSQVEIYRTAGTGTDYAPLGEPLATADVAENGTFTATLNGLRVGEQISAIATHPTYGTSEPARTAVIQSATPTASAVPGPQSPTSLPRCVTPVAQLPPAPLPPEPLRIQVPQRIHFALDRDTISPASARVLDRIAQVLRENPSVLVELEGHTDPRASDAYNLDLGARRARSARNYLLRRGVAPERMTIRSLGEKQRQAAGQSRLDFARDRRVEFIYKDAREIEIIIQDEDLQLEPAGGSR